MADPTREQFDAAARKVSATAPAGLSKDDFYALIDRELSGVPQATLTMGAKANSAPDQPSSAAEEGVLPNTVRALRGEKPGMNVLANLIPLAMSAVPNMNRAPNIGGEFTAANVASRYGNAIGESIKNPPKGLFKKIISPLTNLNDALPSSSERAVSDFVGPKQAAPVEAPPRILSSGPDMWDRAKMASSQEAQGAQAATNAQSQSHIQQAIQQAMEEMLKDSRPQSAQLPEGTSTTIEGFAKQSGKFGKNGRLGQTGGASVKPAMSPETADSLPTTRTDFMGKDVEWPDVSGGSEMGKAAQDIAKGQTERRINPTGELPPGVSERRYLELRDKLGGRGGDAAEGVTLTPETAPPPAAGTAKEALQSAEDRLSGLAKPKLSQQQWSDLVTRQGLTQTARSAGLSKEEVANLAGIDINTPRSRPLEAQDRIDAFNERQARERDR